MAVPAGGRVLVVGDTHGHLKDVVHLFKTHGMPSPANVYVFNGDISDRSDTPARGGMHSVAMRPTQYTLHHPPNPKVVQDSRVRASYVCGEEKKEKWRDVT